jgi:hypothetical protein
LHGPLSKSPDQRGYFSNQMPRTFASKPDYSVKFWKERGLKPVATDVMAVIERRVERLELDTLPACHGNSRLSAADARLEKGYSHMPSHIDLVITSPPYYGMRTYIADQWLRNWFLGGRPEVPYRESCLDNNGRTGRIRHEDRREFDSLEFAVFLCSLEVVPKGRFKVLHLGLLPFLTTITENLDCGTGFQRHWPAKCLQLRWRIERQTKLLVAFRPQILRKYVFSEPRHILPTYDFLPFDLTGITSTL